MHFSERIYNIQNAINQFELPLVIKSANEYSKESSLNTNYEDSLRLPPESINMVERKIAVTFAHVTIIGFSDPDEVEREKGINFIESHSEYEDESYLLPVTFSGKLKIVSPSGKRKRYVDVTQLIDDLPRLICVNDQLTLMDVDTLKTRVVAPGTTLEIVELKTVASNKARSLICRTPENKRVLLKEGMLVNLTAVDDETSYTLTQLKDMNVLLPKYIELQEVTPYNIVINDDLSAHSLLVMAGGPLKINSFVKQEFALCWCPTSSSSGCRSTFNLALIPKQKWRNEKVKMRTFDSESDKKEYIQKHFPGRKDSIFIKYQLYLLDSKDDPSIVYLQDRVPMTDKEGKRKEKKDSTTRPSAIALERDQFPDSDIEDYEQVQPPIVKPPTLPPKCSKTAKSAGQTKKDVEKPPRQWEELKSWIGGLTSKLGLDKVHSEIMHSDIIQKLRHKSGSDRKPALYPKPSTKPRPELRHSVSMETPVSSKTTLKRSQSSASAVRFEPSASSLYYMEFSSTKDSNKQAVRKDQKGLATTRESILSRPRLPIPETIKSVESNESESKYQYDYVEQADLQDSGIDVKDLERVLREGQTAEDFYDYSVEQVTQCFKKIALPQVAKLCENERIDGSFFKDLSEEEIKVHLQLENFHCIKVKKAIFDGWRPK